MDLHNTPTRAVRHDGWTPERRGRFLDCLAGEGNVQLACRAVGLSPEAAYRLKRREPLFARAWAAALLLARDASEQVIADRAIDGIEENVWYRGELLETRRKYDTRLLLAHMARLDKLVDDKGASADAARFDELVACVAGYAPAELLGDDGFPFDRETAGMMAGDAAETEAEKAANAQELDADAQGALHQECIAAWQRGRANGEAYWDAWFAEACGFVDRVVEGRPAPAVSKPAEPVAEAPMVASDLSPWTASTPSTSPFAQAGVGAGARAGSQQPPAPNRAARRAMRAKQRRGR